MMKLSLTVSTLLLASAFDAVCAAPTPTPAASATPTPKGAKAGSAKGIKQMTLVEVTGAGSAEGTTRTDTEVERFMSAFLLQMSERGYGNIADARLSGGKLDDLRGPAGDEFRKAWPAEAYLGVKADHCDIQGYQTYLPDEQRLDNGARVRTNIVIQGYRVSCPVSVTLIGAADGKVLVEIRVTGETGEKLSTEDTEAEGIASEDAAKKAAKKLVAALK
jgi:hypothetical protein